MIFVVIESIDKVEQNFVIYHLNKIIINFSSNDRQTTDPTYSKNNMVGYFKSLIPNGYMHDYRNKGFILNAIEK